MRFKQFLENQPERTVNLGPRQAQQNKPASVRVQPPPMPADPNQTSDHVPTPSNGPEPTVNLNGPNAQGNPKSIVNAKMSMLHSAMISLDPFMNDRKVGGVVSGTPNFWAPEQGSTPETEHDNITNLYLSLRSSNRYLSDMLQPVVQAYKAFSNSYIQVSGMCEAYYVENREMAMRLDLKNFATIKNGVTKVKGTIDDLRSDQHQLAILGYRSAFEQMFRSFDVFFQTFSQIAPRFEAFLQRAYRSVENDRWDKTPPMQPQNNGPDDPDTDVFPYAANM